jgi:alpha-1,2-mannosyltransferase
LEAASHDIGWRRATIAVVVVALGIALASHIRGAREGEGAFLRWRPQVLGLFQGQDIYARYSYPNTPIVALILGPLAAMPPLMGAITFFLLKVLLAVAAFNWALRVAVGRRAWPPAWAVAVIVLLAARPLLSDLGHGNINILVLFLIAAALWLWTRGRSWPAGWILGLAIVVKVTPALFIPYFAWKRDARVLGGCAAGMAVAVLIPALVLGPERNLDLHRAWYQQMIVPYAMHGDVQYTIHINQSLPGVFFRWFTDSPGVHLGRSTPPDRINVASLDPQIAQGVVRILLVAIVLWLGFVCRRSTADRRDWRLACEFSVVLLAMLFMSQRTWKHHFVIAVLPLACLVCYCVTTGRNARRTGLVAVIALVAFLVLTAGMSGEIVGWIYKGVAHKYIEAGGSFFFAGLGVFIALSTILLRHRHPDAHPISLPTSAPDPLTSRS